MSVAMTVAVGSWAGFCMWVHYKWVGPWIDRHIHRLIDRMFGV